MRGKDLYYVGAIARGSHDGFVYSRIDMNLPPQVNPPLPDVPPVTATTAPTPKTPKFNVVVANHRPSATSMVTAQLPAKRKASDSSELGFVFDVSTDSVHSEHHSQRSNACFGS